MAKTARKVDHLFKRPNSQYWRIRLQAGGKSVEKSLGTTDYEQARIDAASIIAEHRARLLAARPRIELAWRHDYAPGLHTLPDGTRIFATDRVVHFLDDHGATIRTATNGEPEHRVVNLEQRLGIPYAPIEVTGAVRPSPPVKDSDDTLFDTYLADSGLTGYPKTEAERMWRLFKTLIGKPLANCTREDGKAIVRHMEDDDDPPKSATLRRRMVPLIATVNLAIKDSKHVGVNPFVSCVTDRDDEVERDPFNDDDLKLMKANLHKLSEQDQLLVRVVATTGMRRGEAFQIDSEETENGIRYCVVGADKGMARRRVPFPKGLLPHLPEAITKSLFAGRPDNAGKRVRAWLAEIGVINEHDGRSLAPNHSFRHRAAQRMRAANIPEDVREAIGGWANGKGKKTSRKYGNKHGKGYALSVLHKAIDKIGGP
jgi:integrase